MMRKAFVWKAAVGVSEYSDRTAWERDARRAAASIALECAQVVNGNGALIVGQHAARLDAATVFINKALRDAGCHGAKTSWVTTSPVSFEAVERLLRDAADRHDAIVVVAGTEAQAFATEFVAAVIGNIHLPGRLLPHKAFVVDCESNRAYVI